MPIPPYSGAGNDETPNPTTDSTYMREMKTYIYVDGFNLYYGALKGTPYKWLDLMVLFQKLLQSHHQILRVKYFTARVSGTKTDPQKSNRQNIYLRAIQKHIPEIEIYYGMFQIPEKIDDTF